MVEHLNGVIEVNLTSTPTKHFMLWTLNNNTHQENYLRILGVTRSIEWELKLFKDVIGEENLANITHHICLLNAYLGYQTLADNLAVGLGPSKKNDAQNYLDQKRVLIEFNNVMIKKIQGSTEDISNLFGPFLSLIRQISVSHNTLAPQQVEVFTRDYLRQHPRILHAELDHYFFEIFILTVTTCLALIDSLKDNPMHEILKKSFLDKYASSNNIVVRSKNASHIKLCEWGLNSIGTIPTLAYCIGALEEIFPHKNFCYVIENNLLLRSLGDAALLTRLLHDVGIQLLTMKIARRELFKMKLYDFAKNQSSQSIFEFLEATSTHPKLSSMMTNIRDALKLGEYNICLDRLSNRKPLIDSITQCCNAIEYYAMLYQNHRKRLLMNLKLLSETLGDDQFSKIIINFVSLHKKKYRMESQTKQGYDILKNEYKRAS